MKIIQVIPFFCFGGAEIMCENLVYELKFKDNNVLVVSLYKKETDITKRLESKGVRIVYLNKKPGFDATMFLKLFNLFNKEHPDIIHTHIDAAKYVFPVAQIMKIKVIHTVHNIATKEAGSLTRKFYKMFYKYSNVTPVALSEKVKKSIVDEYGIDKSKIPVIYNGIDFSKCQPKTDYSINGNFKILHIGRFSEQKNHIGLLQAFKLFHENHMDSELWLIGDGEKKAEIESYVAENNLTSSVKFLGLQSNVYGYLHEADMFTLPSNYEGVPITLIEAMGTGLPIVATDVGGVSDMLTNGVNALIVENDVASVSNSFEIFYCEQEKRNLFGERAKERAKIFSSNVMGGSYIGIYDVK